MVLKTELVLYTNVLRAPILVGRVSTCIHHRGFELDLGYFHIVRVETLTSNTITLTTLTRWSTCLYLILTSGTRKIAIASKWCLHGLCCSNSSPTINACKHVQRTTTATPCLRAVICNLKLCGGRIEPCGATAHRNGRCEQNTSHHD